MNISGSNCYKASCYSAVSVVFLMHKRTLSFCFVITGLGHIVSATTRPLVCSTEGELVGRSN